MKNNIVRVRFTLPKDLLKELKNRENGKYGSVTEYVKAITHEHLTKRIAEQRTDRSKILGIYDEDDDDIFDW